MLDELILQVVVPPVSANIGEVPALKGGARLFLILQSDVNLHTQRSVI